ncbi:F-box/LRR-repeat protein 12 [Carex littledalei]|uniref:F-box/LRR-repeat protein 12 n=1 Tax=Carex littledalei TaxID=544730 RepID=A0A833V212_9POAL|nr:F-box/LRR-repeat protein 12 [Carex littledalei]
MVEKGEETEHPTPSLRETLASTEGAHRQKEPDPLSWNQFRRMSSPGSRSRYFQRYREPYCDRRRVSWNNGKKEAAAIPRRSSLSSGREAFQPDWGKRGELSAGRQTYYPVSTYSHLNYHNRVERDLGNERSGHPLKADLSKSHGVEKENQQGLSSAHIKLSNLNDENRHNGWRPYSPVMARSRSRPLLHWSQATHNAKEDSDSKDTDCHHLPNRGSNRWGLASPNVDGSRSSTVSQWPKVAQDSTKNTNQKESDGWGQNYSSIKNSRSRSLTRSFQAAVDTNNNNKETDRGLKMCPYYYSTLVSTSCSGGTDTKMGTSRARGSDTESAVNPVDPTPEVPNLGQSQLNQNLVEAIGTAAVETIDAVDNHIFQRALIGFAKPKLKPFWLKPLLNDANYLEILDKFVNNVTRSLGTCAPQTCEDSCKFLEQNDCLSKFLQMYLGRFVTEDLIMNMRYDGRNEEVMKYEEETEKPNTYNYEFFSSSDVLPNSVDRSSDAFSHNSTSFSVFQDRGLNALCNGCHKLYALIITSCKGITGTGLKGSPPTLTYLEAETCMLSSEGLREAVSGGGLQYLNLSHPRNLSRHGDGLGHIGSGYAQRLRFLNLCMCHRISDESAFAIAKGCPVLEEWNLAICHGIRLLGWLAIGSNCKKLRVLHVNRCKNLGSQGLNALRDGCDRLEVLYIHGCKGVTNTGLEKFTMYRFNVALRREECETRLIGPCVARLFL